MINGGFESGVTGWIHITSGLSVLEAIQTADAAEGARLGRLMMRTPRTFADIFIFQSVTLPSYPATIALRWKDATMGGGSLQGTYRVLATATGPGVTVLYSSTVGINDSFETWNPHEADLTAYRGRPTIIEFGMTNRIAEPMQLRLDDVRLEVTPTAPLFEVFLGTSATLGSAQRIYRGSSSSTPVAGLAPGTRHFWRVDQLVGTKRIAGSVASFVTDGEIPPQAPVLSVQSVEGELIRIAIPTEAGRTYQLERSTDLSPNGWLAEGDPNSGTGDVIVVEAAMTPTEGCFFRVIAE